MFLGSNAPLGLHDRKNSGYGKISNHFQTLKKSEECYPYGCSAETDEIEFEPDEESLKSIELKFNKKNYKDFFAIKSTNPFYYAAGNSIIECFINPDLMLENIYALGDSMSPIPTKRSKISGGMTSASKKYFYGDETKFRPGHKAGWFSPAPESELYYDPIEDEYDVSVFNMNHFLDKVKKIRGM